MAVMVSLENGAFYKYCVLLGRCEPRIKEFGVLINRPSTNFKKAVDKLIEHFDSGGEKITSSCGLNGNGILSW